MPMCRKIPLCCWPMYCECTESLCSERHEANAALKNGDVRQYTSRPCTTSMAPSAFDISTPSTLTRPSRSSAVPQSFLFPFFPSEMNGEMLQTTVKIQKHKIWLPQIHLSFWVHGYSSAVIFKEIKKPLWIIYSLNILFMVIQLEKVNTLTCELASKISYNWGCNITYYHISSAHKKTPRLP